MCLLPEQIFDVIKVELYGLYILQLRYSQKFMCGCFNVQSAQGAIPMLLSVSDAKSITGGTPM